MEGVDRNTVSAAAACQCLVALLMEGVDRNNQIPEMKASRTVVLLMEGVDRNTKSFEEHGFVIGSPSSWRAWIEIALIHDFVEAPTVSPSSWRAWIEIRWT